jgi:hypothetical protein
VASNTCFREAFNSLLFYGTGGTSSHCFPITTPGAQSTNNLTRARRLGPRWQRQLQSIAVDAGPSHQAPTADCVATIPPTRQTAADTPRSALVKGIALLDTKNRARLPWETCLALAALTTLILLTGIAFYTRAKHTNPGAVAMTDLGAPPANVQSATPSLNVGSVQNTASAKSKALRDESNPSESADRKFASSEREAVRPNLATNRVRAKAVTEGNAKAPVDLANEYLRSEGVPSGCAKAMLLLNTAAAKGNVRARNRLASMYAVGSCVPRDPVRAYRWLSATLSTDPQNQWAQQNRDLLLRQMTAEQRSQIKNTE